VQLINTSHLPDITLILASSSVCYLTRNIDACAWLSPHHTSTSHVRLHAFFWLSLSYRRISKLFSQPPYCYFTFHKKCHLHESWYFRKVGWRTYVISKPKLLCVSSFTRASHFRAAAFCLLLMAGNMRTASWWPIRTNIYTKFRENRSTGSNFVTGEGTQCGDIKDQAIPIEAWTDL
jgi:hypothetical protein